MARVAQGSVMDREWRVLEPVLELELEGDGVREEFQVFKSSRAEQSGFLPCVGRGGAGGAIATTGESTGTWLDRALHGLRRMVLVGRSRVHEECTREGQGHVKF